MAIIQYQVELPDTRYDIDYEPTAERPELSKDEIAEFIRKQNYTPGRPITDDEAKTLPPGIRHSLAGEEKSQWYLSGKGGSVPEARMITRAKMITGLPVSDESKVKIAEAYMRSFDGGLKTGRDENIAKNISAGFRRSGIGSLRTIARLEGPGDNPEVIYQNKLGRIQRMIDLKEGRGEQSFEQWQKDSRKIQMAAALKEGAPTPEELELPNLFALAKKSVPELQEELARTAEEARPTQESVKQWEDKYVAGAIKEVEGLGYIDSLPDADSFLAGVADFGGFVLGGIGSPESLIVWGKAAKGLPIMQRLLTRAGYGAVENVIAEAVISPAVRTAIGLRGEEYGAKEFVTDFGAAAIGGAALKNLFGGIGDAWTKFSGKAVPKGADKVFGEALEGEGMAAAIRKAFGLTEAEAGEFVNSIPADRLRDITKRAVAEAWPIEIEIAASLADQMRGPNPPPITNFSLEVKKRVRAEVLRRFRALAAEEIDTARAAKLASMTREAADAGMTPEQIIQAVEPPAGPKPLLSALEVVKAELNKLPTSFEAATKRMDQAMHPDMPAKAGTPIGERLAGVGEPIIPPTGEVVPVLVRPRPTGAAADISFAERVAAERAALDRAGRLEAIVEQLDADERLRRSPEGAKMLAEQLAAEQGTAVKEPAINISTPSLEAPAQKTVRLGLPEPKRISEIAPEKAVETKPRAAYAEGKKSDAIGKLDAWADKTINESKARLYTGFDPTLLSAYAVKGLKLFSDGLKDFGAWSKEMLKTYGPGAADYLKRAWDNIQRYTADLKEDLQTWRKLVGSDEPIQNVKRAARGEVPVAESVVAAERAGFSKSEIARAAIDEMDTDNILGPAEVVMAALDDNVGLPGPDVRTELALRAESAKNAAPDIAADSAARTLAAKADGPADGAPKRLTELDARTMLDDIGEPEIAGSLRSRTKWRTGIGKTLGKLEKPREKLQTALIWNRAPFINLIKGLPGTRAMERRLRLFQQEAEGVIRDVKDFLIPAARKKITAGAKSVGMEEQAFRDTVYSYGQAIHALEINEHWGRDGFSGLTDAEARAVIAGTPDNVKAAAAPILQDIYSINRRALDLRHISGLITDKFYEQLLSIYPRYVPFKRVLLGEGENYFDNFVHHGQTVRGSGIKGLKGFSELPVQDLLASSLDGFEDAIRRSKSNEMDNYIMDYFTRYSDDKAFKGWAVHRPKVVGYRSFDPDTGEFKMLGKGEVQAEGQVKIPVFEKAPREAIEFRKNGVPQWLIIDNKWVRKAVDNTNMEIGNEMVKSVLSVARVMTSWLSFVYTSGNVGFAPFNLLRDTQAVAINLQRLMGDTGGVNVAQLMVENVKSISALVKYQAVITGKTPGGRLTKDLTEGALKLLGVDESTLSQADLAQEILMIREARRAGALIGGRSALALRDIESSLDKINEGIKSSRGIAEVMNLMEAWNSIFEDANRLSTYKIARARGYSSEEAAIFARSSSFDPAKRGVLTELASSVYIFINPAIQSNVNVAKTFVNKPGVFLKAMGAMFTLAGLQYAWNQRVDPTWSDTTDPYYKDWTFTLLTGKVGGTDAEGNPITNFRRFSLPVAHELIPAYRAFSEMWRTYYGYEARTPEEMHKILLRSMIDGMSPLPLDEGPGSALSPSIIKGFVDVGRNRSFSDRFIHPENGAWKNKKEHRNFWDTTENSATGRFFVRMAQVVAENSGPDWSPEDWRYLTNYYAGGLFKLPSQVADAASKVFSGKFDELSPNDIPILSRFMGEMDAKLNARRKVGEAQLKKDLIEYDTDKADAARNLRRAANAIVKETDPDKRLDLFREAYQNGAFEDSQGNFNEESFEYFAKNALNRLRPSNADARLLSQFGVTDYSRAGAIANRLKRLPDGPSRAQYLDDLRAADPDLLSEKVMQQLQVLIGIMQQRGDFDPQPPAR